MSVPAIQSAFTAGEISPSLFGRTDVARFHVAAATMRNLFVGYRGGAYSRAGTAFVGFSKQTGRGFPPRMVPFQFSINQGLALEFGNFYMRVVSNGAFVTEAPIAIANISQGTPGVISIVPFHVASATPNDAGVTASYAPNDLITLAGGTFTTPGVLQVTTTQLLKLSLNAPGGFSGFPANGGGYVPGCTATLLGGTFLTQAQISVLTTQVTGAAVATTGNSGTPGVQTVTGTTGTGTKFQARVTISASGHVTAVNSITLGGSYSANPTNLNGEPVTGAGLSGAKLILEMGIATFSITSPGSFTNNAVGGNFTQGVCSVAGAQGATFQNALFGPLALSVSNPGIYSAFPPNPVAQASSTGAGLGATFNLTSTGGAALASGDWIFITGVVGMTPVNGQTYVLQQLSPTTFALFDVYGNPINTSGFPPYISGGSAARIFTLNTPYAEADLPWLKFTQSADVMSICCINQDTLIEYQPQDLSRFSDTSWAFTPAVPNPTIAAPTNLAGAANTTGDMNVQYVVTAIDPNNGTESIASNVADVSNAVNFVNTQGSITLTWSPVPNVNQYNIYRTFPVFSSGGSNTPPVGALFGFIGSSYGVSFIDSNIVPDFTQVPPLHRNPFARGQIIGLNIQTGGSGYTQATIGYTITTATGSGAILQPIVLSGALAGWIVTDPGQNYLPTDLIAITDSGGGTGATATLNVGALTGTYPAVVSYIQERRAYAYTIKNPDTYFMSQPGAFTNFDIRIPTIDSDAITGSPWSVEVNGIQAMVPMPGGLVVFTGLSAWQLTGTGGSSFQPQPIGPSTQQAQPQGYNGCSPTVPPVKIENAILYVQAKNSIYREVNFSISTNQYAGDDLTIFSSQLFTGYTIREHAWCEEPYKVLWAVRNDGVLLSCTYLKAQQVYGWARHDTNGLFQSVCSVTELPVDALYTAVERFPNGNTAYMIERMDNRIWADVEATWCVDAGLSLAQPEPNATLMASSATGLGSLTGVVDLVGGAGYTIGTTVSVVDMGVNNDGTGPGTGAVPILSISGGVITGVLFSPQGKGYVNPAITFVDPAGSAGGSGASAQAVVNNSATFSASVPIFSLGNVGNVIRMGGGVATITAFTDNQHVIANITQPIVQTVPNSNGVPQPAPSGAWSLTAPVTSVSGLNHLIGMTVTGLADGVVIPPVVVPASGVVNLPQPSTSVVVGLGFQAQLQSVYLDHGEVTMQGQRKKIAAVTARIEASRGLLAGSNEVDGSTLSPTQVAPQWFVGAGGLTAVPDKGRPAYGSTVVPLFTGDVRVAVAGGINTRGQVAVQQDLPLPMNVLAFISDYLPGDTPQTKAPQKQQGRAA